MAGRLKSRKTENGSQLILTQIKNCITGDFSVVKSSPADEGHTGLIPGPGRFHMLWGD